MAEVPRKPLRILVSNDDGIHAPGLKILTDMARSLSSDVWVVAPETEQSGASHSLTLTEPLRIRQVQRRRFAVRGTPTDCVMLAVEEIIKGRRPDLVLSGVNRGANLAEDVTYSGTIAAAMEGTLLGLPAIALSQAFGFRKDTGTVPWDCAAGHGAKVVARLIETGWPRDVLININFPDCAADQVAGVEVTVQGRRDASSLAIDGRVDARGNAYYWLGFQRERSNPPPGSDLAAIFRGAISVTPLHLDLTHGQTLDPLRRAFAGT